MTLDQLPDLAKVPEIAAFFRCSDKKVYQLIADGDLEAISLGSGYRIAKHAVLAFIGVPPTLKIPDVPVLRAIAGGRQSTDNEIS